MRFHVCECVFLLVCMHERPLIDGFLECFLQRPFLVALFSHGNFPKKLLFFFPYFCFKYHKYLSTYVLYKCFGLVFVMLEPLQPKAPIKKHSMWKNLTCQFPDSGIPHSALRLSCLFQHIKIRIEGESLAEFLDVLPHLANDGVIIEVVDDPGDAAPDDLHF